MDQDQLASLFCSCTHQLINYNDELRALAAADNIGGLSQKMIQGDQVMDSTINCIVEQLEDGKDTLINENLELLIDQQCHLDKRIVDDLLTKVADYEIPTF